MKKTLLLTAFMACASGAMAQVVDIPDGPFFVRFTIPTETGDTEYKFLSRGASWGTEATAGEYGLPITYDSDKKIISFYDWSNTRMFSDDGSSVYTDGAMSKTSTFKFVENDQLETLIKELGTGKFLGVGKGDYGYYVHLVDSAEANVVKIQGLNDYIYGLNDLLENQQFKFLAKCTDKDNASTVYKDPTYIDKYFSSNYAATDLSSQINPSGFTFTKWRNGSNANTTAVELYQGTGTFTQTIEGLKQGVYKVTCHGFERNGSNADQVTLGNAGYELTTTYLEANGYKSQFPSWYSDRATDTNPNNISEATALFNQGKYETSAYAYVGEDGKLEIKVVAPSFKSLHWVMFNNWNLTYYSDTMSDEDAQAAIEKANGLIESPKEATVQEALETALGAFVSDKTLANYNALSAAMTAAEASIAAYEKANTALDGMLKLMENEHAASTEARAEYYNIYQTAREKYADGTLTTEEASALENPYQIYVWHTQNLAFDKYLCSGWDTNPNYQDAPYYVNTWSVEGETDGSEFKVPFYEYFVGSGSLAARTMTATIPVEDKEYKYEVTLWVRGQQDGSNTIDPTAITFDAGGEEVVSLEEGDESLVNGYIFKHVIFNADPNEEGNIVLHINVADNSNIHWLSWKNVRVNKTSTPTGVKAIENGASAATDGAVYNLAGQKTNGLQKGMNIQNGKKVLVK